MTEIEDSVELESFNFLQVLTHFFHLSSFLCLSLLLSQLLCASQATISVCNSSLSEAAILGFEYGYRCTFHYFLYVYVYFISMSIFGLVYNHCSFLFVLYLVPYLSGII